ncbi:MAG: LytTR family transcriptional regulator [Saprospiraceae bacterium]|nr:LytTR family transcriptional regulator [Saprospiraceae bacterium]
MFPSITRAFNKPYVLVVDPAIQLYRAVLFGTFVFLFLSFFKPFELAALPSGLLPLTLIYGVITMGSMVFLNVFLFKQFPKTFKEETWTVGREIGWTLINILVISVGVALYSHLRGIVSLSPGQFILFVGYVFAVGIFPITVGILWREAYLNHRHNLETASINVGLINAGAVRPSLNNAIETNHEKVLLPSDNQDDSLLLTLHHLLYIRSQDNYVEVHFMEGETIKRKVLRASLKTIEQTLHSWPWCMRCHKSFIVNLRQVNRLSGNAQGFRIHFYDLDISVPVSRQFNDQIHQMLPVHP